MAGIDDGYTGDAKLMAGYRAGLLDQEPALNPGKDVIGNIMEGVANSKALIDRYNAVLAGWSDPEADYEKLGEEQAELERKIEAAGAWDLERKVDIAMDALRVPPSEASIAILSGGERRRVALCRLLLSAPDLLLLDEPTNHLDAESVAWLELFLKDYPGTVIAVTHDRYFLDNVAGWILELDHGRGIPFQGNYSGWLEQKQARLSLEEKEASARRRAIERELEWVRMSPKARQAKGKARLTAYERLVAEADEAERRVDRLDLRIPFTQRLGEKVIELHGVSKGYRDRLLIDDLTFSVPPAAVVGIIGPNGAGKTTLFRMITGLEAPDTGSIELGPSVDLAYVDQTRDALTADNTIYREISGGNDLLRIGKREVNARAYVASLNFKGSDQQKRVGNLSGGERNRVHLGKMLRRGGNVVLLDEPSNDLDVDTLRALEEAIVDFPGCVLVISHDRWFLDRICTHILAFEGDSVVRFYPGNYSEYEDWSRKSFGESATQPHRVRYKPLTRS
jgi:ATP-binding cassette ChvD family protein